MKYYFFIFWCLLCLACDRAVQTILPPAEKYLQTIDTCLSGFSETEKAALTSSITVCFRKKNANFDALCLADSIHNFGRKLQSQNRYNEALSFFQEAYRLRKQVYKNDCTPVGILRSHTMIGVCNAHLQNYRTALLHFDSAFRCGPPASFFRVYILFEKGRTYLDVHEMSLAENCFESALDSAHARYPGNPNVLRWLPELYEGYVSCLRKMGKYRQAIQVWEASTNRESADMQSILGNVWQDSMKRCRIQNREYCDAARDSAMLHIQNSLHRYITDNNFSRALLATSNMGALLLRTKQFEQADTLLSNTLTDKRYSKIPRREFAPLLVNLGDALCETGRVERGISRYWEAIQSLRVDTSRRRISITEDFSIEDLPDLLIAYSAIAAAYLRLNSPEALSKAVEAYGNLVQLTNHARDKLITQHAKLDLAQQIQEALAKAVGVCLQLYRRQKDERYKIEALSFSEQSKGFALVEAIRLRNPGAPNSNQQKQQKNALQELNLHKIQNNLLEADQAFLSYFVQDTVLHIFIIRRDRIGWTQKIINPEALSALVSVYLDRIQDSVLRLGPDLGIMRVGDSLGHELYRVLVEPIRENLPRRLVIARSDPFLGIPFEALVEKFPYDSLSLMDQKKNYLLFRFCISYASSANIWALMQKAQPRKNLERKVAAFAPLFQLDSASSPKTPLLQPLFNNRIEIQEIAKMAPSDTIDAFKKNFIEAAKKFEIIHLATHGFCNLQDPNQSFVAFNQLGPQINEEQLLYLPVLYVLDLPQRLIVLSACETSRGKYIAGEGNISIERGLACAGAQSFITTLWSIETWPNTKIMPDFYKMIWNGKSKDEALTTAKRHFIDINNSKIPPLLWAGIVLNGNTEPLRQSDVQTGIYRVLAIVLLMACLVWLLIRFLRSTKIQPT